MNSKQIRALIISVTLAGIIYGLWIVLSEPEKIYQSFHQVGWQGMGLLLGLSLFNYGVRALRYHYLMLVLGDRVPLGLNILYYFSGFALTTTPGKAGESIKAIYLKKFNVPFSHVIAVLLSERLLDLIAVWFIAMLSIFHFNEYQLLIIAISIGLTAGTFLLQKPIVSRILYRWSGRTKHQWLSKILDFTSNALEKTGKLLNLKSYVIGLGLGVLAWGSEAYGFVVLLQLLGYSLDPVVLASIYAASMLVGALSFLPGGLGGAEITMHFLLLELSVTQADSIAATLVCRIATLWFAVVIGILVILGLELYYYQQEMNTKKKLL